MGDIIDINRASKPDAENVFIDGDGVSWFKFTCTYVDNRGAEMGFTIWALDHSDADIRINTIKQSAKVDGQLYATIKT